MFRDNLRDGPMLLGYARVSTNDQDLAIQRRALRKAGCRRLFEEKLSGAQRNRPELARLLDHVRDEDVAHLSPLGFEHTNRLGCYAFILPDAVAHSELRPLRNPIA